MNVAARVCRSPDSWPWTDHSQINLIHLPTPPKCSTRAIMALINNLGIVYHQYCSSSIATTNPKVAMALKSHTARDLDLRSVWLLDKQSTFDLCCNPDFAHKQRDAKRAMHMSSNGGGICISKECKVSGYDFWVWFTK